MQAMLMALLSNRQGSIAIVGCLCALIGFRLLGRTLVHRVAGLAVFGAAGAAGAFLGLPGSGFLPASTIPALPGVIQPAASGGPSAGPGGFSFAPGVQSHADNAQASFAKVTAALNGGGSGTEARPGPDGQTDLMDRNQIKMPGAGPGAKVTVQSPPQPYLVPMRPAASR